MRFRSSSPVLLALLSFNVPQSLAYPSRYGASVFRGEYESTVCHPLTDASPKTVAPCIEIETIEILCTPNGTSPLALKAHQQCMCGGSFFDEWPYCLQCLFFHGLRSERDVFFYKDVIATASSALCEVPTPTAEFKSIFESVRGIVPVPTTGGTISSDQAVGQTAISLYYTATVSQGPGRITGEATAATATATGLLLAPSSHPGASDEVDGNELSTVLSAPTQPGSDTSDGVSSTSPTVVNSNGTVKTKRPRRESICAFVVAMAVLVTL